MPGLSNVEMFWKEKQQALQQHMASGPWTTFIQWSTIQANMWVGEVAYIDEEYAALPPRWKAVLHEEGFGATNIPRYRTSGNLIHQAYHLSVWEQVTGRRVEDLDRIVEVGGGYGALVRLVLRQGFAGKFYVYDLPELVKLQLHYLHFPPNFYPDTDPGYLPENPDLLISLYALSEFPPDLRARLMPRFHPRSWLLVYQDSFDEVDNLDYFADFTLSRPEYRWQTQPTIGFENHRYLIGDLE